jgi:hypothetical protein
MTDVSRISKQVQEFSRFLDRGDVPTDLKEELVALASEMRARERSYHFEYHRPDSAPFRLRSQKPPGSSSRERVIQFLEPGRTLRVELDGVDEDVFDGICAELTIIGGRDESSEPEVREAELNLLRGRVFQAELYAEFQRWERYDSPLYVVSATVSGTEDWQSAARELKHFGNQRDLFGRTAEEQVAGVFSSREHDEQFEEDLEDRMNVRYEEDELKLVITHVPTDVTDWNQLQTHISDLESEEERDFVGN